MNETFCGKICENCAWREEHACPGCQAGPGGRGGDCEIAACCREKGHTNCTTCGFQLNCLRLRAREELPQRRQYMMEAREAKKQWHSDMAPLLGKWLWISFWLIVPGFVVELFTNERLISSPVLGKVGALLSMVLVCISAVCLLKLAPAEPRYRVAGWCSLGAGLLSELVTLLGLDASGWGLLLLLPAMPVSLYAEYQEFHAHAAVLEGLDDELAEKWLKLWKWEVGFLLGLFGCILVMLLIPMLGALALLADAIALVVVGILRLVYLYRTAKLFREYPVEERLALPDETTV